MAKTTNLQLPLLDVGQREKEATLNTALQGLDKNWWLGKLSANPTLTDSSGTRIIFPGARYYNTTSNKIRTLIDDTTWVE